MPIASGSRLGAYEVLSALGAGGMGEVYRARDTKLKREVALKVLPEAFASDPDRLARFQREAELLATLNHPNIAAVYGLEDAGGVVAIVLELVEGDTLADRIARGPVPVHEALEIAMRIADALEAAHEAGIVHRDLKPANIKVRDDGTVKVLDFGLAKAMDPTSSSAAKAMNSPTLSIHATQAGVILGTAAYMSPEQARGRAVDRRADIWAFGVVLYEMLTGRRAFDGDDISITLANVLKDDVSWQSLPADLPAPLRRLLRRCLEKDPRRRLNSIGDARLELDEAGSTADGDGVLAPTPVAAAVVPAWRRALPWTVAGLACAAAAAILVQWAPWRLAPASAPIRLNAELGADASLDSSQGPSITLSPDGSVLAFVALKSGATVSQLYVRRLGQLVAAPLSGTDGAFGPFFSPNGQWLAFFAGGSLKKISVTGGAAVTLCDAPNGRGGSWADDGTIAFLPQNGPGVSLLRVSAAGGKPEPLTTLAEGEVTQRWPQMLPGSKAVLYSGSSNSGGFENANIVVQPLPGGARKIVQRGGYYGRYLASGHLVFIHEGTLFAAPFDLDRLETTGPPVPVLQGVAATAGDGAAAASTPGVGPNSAAGGGAAGAAHFSVSNTGTLAYLAGQGFSSNAPIQWLSRDGKVTSLLSASENWSNPHFAPDGRRLAVEIFDGRQWDIWTYEWARDTLSRLTFDATDDEKPVWTPDGRRIVFAGRRADKSNFNLYWQRADGTGDVQRLTESKNPQFPASWHPSGRFLAFIESAPQTLSDLMILPLEGDEASGWRPGEPTVFLRTPFAEHEPMFSPDGQWIAYHSNETGRNEVYVRPFPGPGGKWQISTGGGTYPSWSRARHELFYSTPDRQIAFASYAVEGDVFRADKPRLWSSERFTLRVRQRSIDLHPDGDRFALAAVPAEAAAAKHDKVVFIFNFFDELRRLAPATKH